MSTSKDQIKTDIIGLEEAFNERWSQGDNRGYLDNFADEVSYFDPILKNILVGRDKVRAWNATHAYHLINGEWRILHSNRAFAQTISENIAS